MQILACLTATALAAEPRSDADLAPPSTAHVEPVLDLARTDLRALRVSRLAVVTALTAPGLFFVGDASARAFADTPGPGHEIGLTFMIGGAVACFVAPPALFYGAARSRSALRQQGLHLPATRAWLAVPLWATSYGLLATLRFTYPDQVGRYRGGLLIALSSYSAASLIGAVDLQGNHRARRDAGWLGLVPTVGQPGLALAGTW